MLSNDIVFLLPCTLVIFILFLFAFVPTISFASYCIWLFTVAATTIDIDLTSYGKL
jgi:hypothetical protein